MHCLGKMYCILCKHALSLQDCPRTNLLFSTKCCVLTLKCCGTVEVAYTALWEVRRERWAGWMATCYEDVEWVQGMGEVSLVWTGPAFIIILTLGLQHIMEGGSHLWAEQERTQQLWQRSGMEGMGPTGQRRQRGLPSTLLYMCQALSYHFNEWV